MVPFCSVIYHFILSLRFWFSFCHAFGSHSVMLLVRLWYHFILSLHFWFSFCHAFGLIMVPLHFVIAFLVLILSCFWFDYGTTSLCHCAFGSVTCTCMYHFILSSCLWVCYGVLCRCLSVHLWYYFVLSW